MNEPLAVTNAKVQYIPNGTYIDRNGEEHVKFMRVGTRIELANGEWWFCTSRGAWTRHTVGPIRRHNSGSPVLMDNGEPERMAGRIESYRNDTRLREAYGHCPKLINALNLGLILAEES